MLRKLLFILLVTTSMLFSCKKVDSITTEIQGTWKRVVFDHGGTESWIFAADKIYVILDYPKYDVSSDTVSIGTYTTEIVRYTHGALFNKNILTVPAITITGFENFKYNQGQQNIWYPAYNTVWEVHKLDATTLILTTDEYEATPGGLEIREFYKE